MDFTCSCRAEPLRVLTHLCVNWLPHYGLNNLRRNSSILSKVCHYRMRYPLSALARHVGSIKPPQFALWQRVGTTALRTMWQTSMPANTPFIFGKTAARRPRVWYGDMDASAGFLIR